MNANKSDWITTVIRDISELGERTSPDDFPDAMLVTAEELRCILTRVAPAPVEQAAPSEVQRIAFDRLRTAVGLSDACDETVLMLNAAVRIERLTAEASQAAPVTVPNGWKLVNESDLLAVKHALESCDSGDYSTGNVIYPSFDVQAVNESLDVLTALLAAAPAAPVEQAGPTPDELRLLQQKAFAFDEWIVKTDWVQEQMATFPVTSLGKHRADVMREEIERLRAEQAAPVTVPKLTDEQIALMARKFESIKFGFNAIGFARAMLAAAPAPSADAQDAKLSNDEQIIRRREIADAAWAAYSERAKTDSMLPRISVHQLRTAITVAIDAALSAQKEGE